MSADGEIWAIDTEWGFWNRCLDWESLWEPVVLCLVGLLSGRRIFFWRRDPLLPAFFRDHAGDLFVAHNVVAEMKYLLRLGITLPQRWFDTFIAYRYHANRPQGIEAGLSLALHRFGLASVAPAEKKALQLAIVNLEFDLDNAEDQRRITNYCFSDCDGCGHLYQRLASACDSTRMDHWIEFMKAVARMELRGISCDAGLYSRIVSKRSTIQQALIGNVNKTWPVFKAKSGDMGLASFDKKSFLNWCETSGIDWPRQFSKATKTTYQALTDEAFKDMETRHPFIAELRQVRKTIKQLEGRSLVIDGNSGRHYFSTSPFRSVTGRNQPKNFIFSGPKWLRQLIMAESPDHVLVYVDFEAQEPCIAAALSRDAAMRAVCQEKDCHMALAIRAGAAPANATKGTHGGIRKQYKTTNLGVLYGQAEGGISRRLGISLAIADGLLGDHKRLFPEFWNWSDAIVQTSYDRGWIATPCGWRSWVPPVSKETTWMNWPMQATGGDIMRLTMTYLDRQNVRLLCPVHDGFLLSCRRQQLGELREAVDFACSTAVDQVLPGAMLRWTVEVHDSRFEDADGLPLWNRLMGIVGANGL